MDIKLWIKRHWQYITLYILSTIFFIYQHYVQHNLWDFYAYVLNGQFLFHHGIYYELCRPPLTPIILGLLGGNLFSEYAYIILVSSIFAIVTYYLAKKLKVDDVTFYALFLNAFLLMYGLSNGTELISLALLELTVLFVLKDDIKSGLSLALAFLTRYTFAPYSLILFFHKKKKNILYAIAILVITVIPWLIYNKIVFGNFFASIADSYALSVVSRRARFQLPRLSDFLIAGNVLWIFIGISLFKKKIKVNRQSLLFLTILILAIFGYVFTPFKETRYLFPIMLPLVYFSIPSVNRKLAYSLFAVMLLIAFLTQPIVTDYYKYPIQKLKELNVSNCYLESNLWVFFDYYGLPTHPAVYSKSVNHEVNVGRILILYKHAEFYTNDSKVLYDNGNYVILGEKNCTRGSKQVVYSYIKQLNYDNSLLGLRDNYTYCDFFMPRLCKLVNKI